MIEVYSVGFAHSDRNRRTRLSPDSTKRCFRLKALAVEHANPINMNPARPADADPALLGVRSMLGGLGGYIDIDRARCKVGLNPWPVALTQMAARFMRPEVLAIRSA